LTWNDETQTISHYPFVILRARALRMKKNYL
jgi:hypothetical protein